MEHASAPDPVEPSTPHLPPWETPGRVQEWFGSSQDSCLAIPGYLAVRQVMRQAETGRGWIVWIGRRAWPYPWMLTHPAHRAALHRSILMNPIDSPSRLWAMEVAMRCESVAAVVADGGGLEMTATRRLQLLARQRQVWISLLRPPADRTKLSAAALRWHVEPIVTEGDRPRWSVRMLRCKGMRPQVGMEAEPVWRMEWNGAKGLIHLPADLADRSRAEAGGEIAAMRRLG